MIQAQVPLAELTTWRVGGAAEWYCLPSSISELQADLAAVGAVPHTVLGLGSNVLISDQGLAGLVINLRKLRGLEALGAGRVRVAAGEPIIKVAHWAAAQGWHGLEWAVGIPGSVGGAVAMNAGAHGRCLGDVLVAATYLDAQQQLQTATAAELDFRYRHSRVQTEGWVVLEAELQLEPGHDPQMLQAQTQKNWQQRRDSQPYDLPSCGSVFRNPQSHAAGWLIEQTGLKGLRLGGAEVAERHANFILNRDQATAQEIFQLIQVVRDRVANKWQICLQPEVKMLGEFER